MQHLELRPVYPPVYIWWPLSSTGWPWQKHLQLFLFQHSPSAYLVPHLPTVSQMLIHSFLHFTSGPSNTFSLNLVIIHSLWQIILIHSYHMSKTYQNSMFHPFIHFKIQFLCCYTHIKSLIHGSITFSISSCTPYIAFFHCVYPWFLLYVFHFIPHTCLMHIIELGG